MNSTTAAVLVAGLMIAAAIVWHAYSERRTELECREATQAYCEKEYRNHDLWYRERCTVGNVVACRGGILND